MEKKTVLCPHCQVEAFRAEVATGPKEYLQVFTQEKGIFGATHVSYVRCYVCPECGRIELYADEPKRLQIKK